MTDPTLDRDAGFASREANSLRSIRTAALAAVMGFALNVGVANHGIAQSQGKSVEQQLVGTWIFASGVFTRPDGTPYEAFGDSPRGILMFDRMGHFALELMGGTRRPFASNNRFKGTPDENKAAVTGMLAYYGTYSVDDTGHNITYHVERSSFPNYDGTDVTRIITLTGDEFKGVAPVASAGGRADLLWRRAK